MDRKIEHLESIQGVVDRLASDSFRMKEWCVDLIATLFALPVREGRIEVVDITPISVFFFQGTTAPFLNGLLLYAERVRSQ